MSALVAYERGRLDAARGRGRVLFGHVYEDSEIEASAFAPGGRVFCIASAGDTAMRLARDHAVVAVDINPVQLEYARARLAGGPAVRGAAERLMDGARAFGPLVGWSEARVNAFVEAATVEEQLELWRALETRRFRWAFGVLLSLAMLRAVYASPLLSCLPPRLGAVMRARVRRALERHPNRDNPFARLLFAGAAPPTPAPARGSDVELVRADAASYLESAPAASFDGFSLSNILDGAGPVYEARVLRAVARAAKPNAKLVIRSFSEPTIPSDNRAAEDRSMLWGVVSVTNAVASAR